MPWRTSACGPKSWSASCRCWRLSGARYAAGDSDVMVVSIFVLWKLSRMPSGSPS